MRRRGFLAIVLAFVALSTPAAAQWRHPRFGGGVQRLDRILPGIRMAHPGRFYDAEGPFRDTAGGLHYRIKWLTPDGRVIWLDTDARTGRVIGPGGLAAPNVLAPAGAMPYAPVPNGPAILRPYPRGGWGRPGFGGWSGRGGRWPGR
ncbi:MAG TPA: hypothetical protein VII49_07510 [Rhizomicrobium sp.]